MRETSWTCRLWENGHLGSEGTVLTDSVKSFGGPHPEGRDHHSDGNDSTAYYPEHYKKLRLPRTVRLRFKFFDPQVRHVSSNKTNTFYDIPDAEVGMGMGMGVGGKYKPREGGGEGLVGGVQ